MSEYRHILVALELEDDGRAVLARAHALAQVAGARLSVLHVLETMPLRSATMGDLDTPLLPPVDISEQLSQNALARLRPWCEELGIAADALEVIIDVVKAGIADHAERIAADLIVIGRRPHHGLSALFSHTEEGVLSRARCDVLAVALPAAD